MFQQNVTIRAIHGLHIRPAAKFVKEAKKFVSNITVIFNSKSVNAKSLFKLQTIGLSYGSIVTICAVGKDEKEAVDHLSKILSELQ
ncbi:HPr family phosphocarrier protein [Candidatus Purcelliella pentastirinorum]|uniref:Phosphocarrier protein HPr n=1 Tax=Candidatus Purcelliella pentastirinorum TaxID=472834 RepID=A0AAX3N7T8_9ENTR|nr:HPr family phosphocarrier protein [Candidatus Purcelliella pentastirinorum]WDI78594.1 HPr family phosphocarrier protein [Candidatus Purcelliella pentastirinorum]WDR80378.1 HPr family phosphocarrier protein [Candidatus Purcelliella pentastirinorum]